MYLAEVGFINAIHFGELDVLFLQGGGRFLIVGGKRLAVPAPSKDNRVLALAVAIKHVT